MILPPEKLIPHANLNAYLMDPMPFPWGDMLAPYSPPLPKEGRVILASFFGDAFIEDSKGVVWWVNGLEARVDKIGINREQAVARIEQDHLVTLKTKLMEQLIKGDKLLPVGKIYGLQTPRSEGGKYHPDNIGTAPIAEAFAYMGDQFRRANAPKAPPPRSTDTPLAMPKLDAKDEKKGQDKKGLWGKKK